MVKLDPRPVRHDVTDRECTQIIGGLLGSLIQVTTPEELRRAVRWWAESDEAWAMLTRTPELVDDALSQMIADRMKGGH